jgi:hypothetical protein
MWATVALSTALTLAPAQKGGLDFENVRMSYSMLGHERKSAKLYPGDILFLKFDIVGLEMAANGRVQYSMGTELTRKGAKTPEMKKSPQPLEAINALGGNRLPATAVAIIGTDTKPGTYTMKVTVTDSKTKKSRDLVRTFEVVEPKLGFVRAGLFYTPGPEMAAPPVGAVGQILYVHFSLVGFTLDKKTNQPDISVKMQVLDDAGKPTVRDPFSGKVTKVEKVFQQMLPFDPITLQLNRPGKFTIVLEATDNLAKEKTTHRIPLTVVEEK